MKAKQFTSPTTTTVVTYTDAATFTLTRIANNVAIGIPFFNPSRFAFSTYECGNFVFKLSTQAGLSLRSRGRTNSARFETWKEAGCEIHIAAFNGYMNLATADEAAANKLIKELADGFLTFTQNAHEDTERHKRGGGKRSPEQRHLNGG
jgi:hypothetical protein